MVFSKANNFVSGGLMDYVLYVEIKKQNPKLKFQNGSAYK